MKNTALGRPSLFLGAESDLGAVGMGAASEVCEWTSLGWSVSSSHAHLQLWEIGCLPSLLRGGDSGICFGACFYRPIWSGFSSAFLRGTSRPGGASWMKMQEQAWSPRRSLPHPLSCPDHSEAQLWLSKKWLGQEVQVVWLWQSTEGWKLRQLVGS